VAGWNSSTTSAGVTGTTATVFSREYSRGKVNALDVSSACKPGDDDDDDDDNDDDCSSSLPL